MTASFETDFDRADYIHRGATGWKGVFDAFPVPLSPRYHALRMMYGWEPVPVPSGTAAPEPLYLRLYRAEGRTESDPCEGKV